MSKRAEAKIRAIRDENRACEEGIGAHVLKGNVQARRDKIWAVRDESRACAEGKCAHVLKGNVQARRDKIWAIRDENRACAEGKGARKMRRVIDSPWIFLYDILILTKGFRIPS